ncbi:hypothetical protein [Pleionea sp. CnH1-48]|nr:hypothetical protein [Pleionea sp. CnH1-48]
MNTQQRLSAVKGAKILEKLKNTGIIPALESALFAVVQTLRTCG